MTAKKIIMAAAMAVLVPVGASAQGIIIPEGNPIGITESITESGMAPTVGGVTVSIDISGGNNGDLVGYLSYDGVIVTLLNRPGVSGGNPLGFTGSGFNVTISDTGSLNLNTAPETAGSPLTGIFNVNGTPGLNGTAANGSLAFGSAYDGLNPNGTWTLFLANEASGGDPSMLVSWSLSIDAVPEPTNIALGIFGVCAVAGRLRAGWKKRSASNPIEE
jgi:hypothetical protein